MTSDEHAPGAIVRRVMPAPPEVVFDEWLDAEALADFMGPLPAKAQVLECDPRVGGHLSIVMSDEDFVVKITGEYLELDRPHRLRFSWHSDMGDGFESTVTVTLRPYGDGQTLMTIEHSAIPAEFADDHQGGWAIIAEQLATRVSAKA